MRGACAPETSIPARKVEDGAGVDDEPRQGSARPVGGVAVVEKDGVAGRVAEPGALADTRVPHLVDLHAGRLELRLRLGDIGDA